MRKNLTRAFILAIFMCFTVKGFCLSDKIRLGLYAEPGIAWAAPAGNDLNKGKPRFGINYGLAAEFWFAKNYGFATGLAGAYDGCNVTGRTIFEKDDAGNFRYNVTEKYTFHYLILPVHLKLKTNPIKGSNFSIWGQLGADVQITVSARATFNNPVPNYFDTTYVTIEKENILKPKNAVITSIPGFRSNFFDIRLTGGFGFDYKLDEKTSLLLGVFYHNGFINNIIDRDSKKEPIVMRNFGIRFGILF